MIQKIKNYYKEIITITFKPKIFFKNIKDEKTIKKSFIFLSIFTFVAFIFLTYYYIEQINSMLKQITTLMGVFPIHLDITIKLYIIFYISFIIVYIITAFLRYYIIHFYVRLFKGKHKYYQTYKALSYSLAPEYFSTPLFIALFVLIPMTIISKNPGLIIATIIMGIIYTLIFIYTVYLRTYALSKLQNISMTLSFISIYILGLITLVFFMAILEIIFVVMFFIFYLLVFDGSRIFTLA